MVSLFKLRYMNKLLFLVLCSVLSHTSQAWNAVGHKLVAQIAYDHLTPQVKQRCHEYSRAYAKGARGNNFVVNATWLDSIRARDIHWFDSLHYIDIPFSNDNTPLPPAQKVNALSGIKHAITVLSSPRASASDKGLSLRILTHVIGDIHQPLHTVTQVSKAHPKGDMGGNLFPLAANKEGNNLHRYWDNGAGLLKNSKKAQITAKAQQLSTQWSCSKAGMESKPEQWIKAAHQLAVSQAYNTATNKRPTKHYQLNAQRITEQQIAYAGCRLAYVLNSTIK